MAALNPRFSRGGQPTVCQHFTQSNPLNFQGVTFRISLTINQLAATAFWLTERLPPSLQAASGQAAGLLIGEDAGIQKT